MQNDGMNLWRQMGETLANEITNGVWTPGSRIPSAPDLAIRFGVNRHTALRALAHLQDEGLVRIERGRGAFVVEDVISYRMGPRTRFEENLVGLNRVPSRKLISLGDLPADEAVAAGLGIPVGQTATLARLLGEANGLPLSYGSNYFPTSRLPGISEVFRSAQQEEKERLSITACLHQVGITDFQRKMMRVRSRQPTNDEARYLRMPPNESVLEVIVTNVDSDGIPVMYAATCFCSSRVEFVMDM
ncbi:phosphonate metabolism transcriptional regulator PhnF [Phyllobacterium zundukense]|uniref:Phosphonate metabolism transcriptional regulator PhnF n=1 Tax=Phyllobacterium zundukense TaxID=1867719 RepID=A0A2N9VYU0_9HYPH|nr:phosphonate metabolism transcriptional regulator PhnF [Phyllobacterium zundukense]ATU95240.1 phosphonate metabolism transcriptional regulator PhnF [Phyllobacterium zundukense]PIO44658.1 phosphonate metabolism transcriptional regulator PhnF [Phyllobacterium zundukense]